MASQDPHQWLEDVLGDKPLNWAKERNDECIGTVGDPSKTEVYRRILQVYDSKDKIPGLTRIGDEYYNFWRDEQHVQGIWRKTTLDSYSDVKNTKWETVIDVDALPPPVTGTASTWVWHGASVLDQGPISKWDRALVSLSPGGSDADTMREFDLVAKKFLDPDTEKGFALPTPAKTDAGYRSRDELLVGTDFGGDSTCLTDSGYPRVVKAWKRGEPIEAAEVVFEGEKTDIAANQYAYYDRGHWHEFQRRTITFYTAAFNYRVPKDVATVGAKEDATPFASVPIQLDASLSTFGDAALIELRSPWRPPPSAAAAAGGKEYAAGSLLSCPMASCARGDFAQLVALFEPTETCSLQAQTGTKNYLVLKVLDDVQADLRFWRYLGEGKWRLEEQQAKTGGAAKGAAKGAVGVGEDVTLGAVWPDDSDDLWIWRDGYLVPSTLELGSAADSLSLASKKRSLRAMPSMFDASGLVVQQHFASSLDGTKVPFFVIMREDAPKDGTNPTLLDAYGGFEISMLPGYSAGVGVGWLERGGIKVIANIRGGGEYGPEWHQAALRERRHRAYEDLEAVARALCEAPLLLTSPEKLACIGGSNGGLLVGNMITRATAAPLFAAAVCQVPLLDMKVYSHLLAGASWMAEYGDPDKPEDWAFLRRHSPYQILRHDRLGLPETPPSSSDPPDAAANKKKEKPNPDLIGPDGSPEKWKCPRVLFTTSTRDDRVHPGHARKMVAALREAEKASVPEVLYWENLEGGHGGAADNKQRAYMWALSFEFVARALGLPPSEPAKPPGSEG